MNDFTKEELEIIDYAVSNLDYNGQLRDKIQSMIDNYCQHDSCGGEIEEFIDICSKCKAFVLRESHYE